MAVLINCVLTNCVLINCVLINCVLINWIQLIQLIQLIQSIQLIQLIQQALQLALTPVLALVPVPLLVTGTGPPTPGLTCTGLPVPNYRHRCRRTGSGYWHRHRRTGRYRRTGTATDTAAGTLQIDVRHKEAPYEKTSAASEEIHPGPTMEGTHEGQATRVAQSI